MRPNVRVESWGNSTAQIWSYLETTRLGGVCSTAGLYEATAGDRERGYFLGFGVRAGECERAPLLRRDSRAGAAALGRSSGTFGGGSVGFSQVSFPAPPHQGQVSVIISFSAAGFFFAGVFLLAMNGLRFAINYVVFVIGQASRQKKRRPFSDCLQCARSQFQILLDLLYHVRRWAVRDFP